jgi:hypothetical protein
MIEEPGKGPFLRRSSTWVKETLPTSFGENEED